MSFKSIWLARAWGRVLPGCLCCQYASKNAGGVVGQEMEHRVWGAIYTVDVFSWELAGRGLEGRKGLPGVPGPCGLPRKQTALSGINSCPVSRSVPCLTFCLTFCLEVLSRLTD